MHDLAGNARDMHSPPPIVGILVVLVVVLSGMHVVQELGAGEGCDWPRPPSQFSGLLAFTDWGGFDPTSQGMYPLHTGYQDIFLLDTNDDCAIRFTIKPGNELGADLRSDGKRIAYSDGIIQIMNVDGSDSVEVRSGTSDQGVPRWSPDGAWIVYTEPTGAATDIFVMRADGTERRRLTDNSVADSGPDWSPDGTRIVFAQGSRPGGSPTDDMDLYLMNPDGSDVTRLTDLIGLVGDPAWSPDGSQIAFASNFPYDWDIFVINSDGRNLRQLTDDPHYNRSPIWSPDGSLIAYYSTYEEPGKWRETNTYVINRDGSNRVSWETFAGGATLSSWVTN